MTRQIPRGPFATILADPAWQFQTRSEKGRGRCPDAIVNSRAAQRRNQAERHYATMTLEEIKALPVGNVAAKDCILFLWAIDPMLPQALEVGAAWGFTYKTVGFYWAKLRKLGREKLRESRADVLDEERKTFPMGTGYWTRANPEQCLLFTRGRPERLSAGVAKLIAMEGPPPCRYCDDTGWFYGDEELGPCGCGIEPPIGGKTHPSLIVSPRREHSRKPDEQYERIEQLVGGPYLELFARQERPGWTAWGDQTDRFGTHETPSRVSQDRRTDVFDLRGPSEGLKRADTRPQDLHTDIASLIG